MRVEIGAPANLQAQPDFDSEVGTGWRLRDLVDRRRRCVQFVDQRQHFVIAGVGVQYSLVPLDRLNRFVLQPRDVAELAQCDEVFGIERERNSEDDLCFVQPAGVKERPTVDHLSVEVVWLVLQIALTE